MNLEKITSLFDLERKAETNSHYKQLAVITSGYLKGEWWYSSQGKKATDIGFKAALEYLEFYSGRKSCKVSCQYLNDMIKHVVQELPEKPRKPVSTAFTEWDEDMGCYYRKKSYFDDDEF